MIMSYFETTRVRLLCPPLVLRVPRLCRHVNIQFLQFYLEHTMASRMDTFFFSYIYKITMISLWRICMTFDNFNIAFILQQAHAQWIPYKSLKSLHYISEFICTIERRLASGHYGGEVNKLGLELSCFAWVTWIKRSVTSKILDIKTAGVVNWLGNELTWLEEWWGATTVLGILLL